MSSEKRTLAYHFLGLAQKENGEIKNIFTEKNMQDFCQEFSVLSQSEKLLDISYSRKLVELQSLKVYSKQNILFFRGLVRAGKYNHSLDYLSRKTGKIRATDKSLDEAYAEKTHFLGKINTDGIVLLFENRQSGASIKMVVQCLTKIWNKLGHDGYFYSHYISVDDLEDAINRLTRVKIGHVYLDKQCHNRHLSNKKNK